MICQPEAPKLRCQIACCVTIFPTPTGVPDYVSRHFPRGEWLKAKEGDLALSSDIEFLCDNCLPPTTDPAVDDGDSSDDTSSLPLVCTTTVTEFPLRVLATVYHAKKLQLYPETETLFVCHQEITMSLLDQALANVDTSPWDTQLAACRSRDTSLPPMYSSLWTAFVCFVTC
jgi:hypothetical protein